MKRMPLELLNFDWDLVRTKFINDFPYSPSYQVKISDLVENYKYNRKIGYRFTIEIDRKNKIMKKGQTKLTTSLFKAFYFTNKDFYSSEFAFVEIFERAITTKVYELFNEMNLK